MSTWHPIELLCETCDEWRSTALSTTKENFEAGDGPFMHGSGAYVLSCGHAVPFDNYSARLGQEEPAPAATLDDSEANPSPEPQEPTEARPTGRWRGIRGGTIDDLFVGTHVIDHQSGVRGQVEQALPDGSGLVRLADGTIVKIKLGSPPL